MDIEKEREEFEKLPAVAELIKTNDVLWSEVHGEYFGSDHELDCWIDGAWAVWQAKSQVVPDLGELQERIAGHQYYHDEHGHMIVDMDDVVKEISGFDSWKAKAVPEWVVMVPRLSANYLFSKVPELGFKHKDEKDTVLYHLNYMASEFNAGAKSFVEQDHAKQQTMFEAQEQSHE